MSGAWLNAASLLDETDACFIVRDVNGRRRPGVGLDWSVEDRVCQTDVTLCRTVWGGLGQKYS